MAKAMDERVNNEVALASLALRALNNLAALCCLFLSGLDMTANNRLVQPNCSVPEAILTYSVFSLGFAACKSRSNKK